MVDEGLAATEGLADGGEFSFAEGFFLQIDELVFNGALFEVALGFLGVKGFTGAEDLDVHYIIPFLWLIFFCFTNLQGSQTLCIS